MRAQALETLSPPPPERRPSPRAPERREARFTLEERAPAQPAPRSAQPAPREDRRPPPPSSESGSPDNRTPPAAPRPDRPDPVVGSDGPPRPTPPASDPAPLAAEAAGAVAGPPAPAVPVAPLPELSPLHAAGGLAVPIPPPSDAALPGVTPLMPATGEASPAFSTAPAIITAPASNLVIVGPTGVITAGATAGAASAVEDVAIGQPGKGGAPSPGATTSDGAIAAHGPGDRRGGEGPVADPRGAEARASEGRIPDGRAVEARPASPAPVAGTVPAAALAPPEALPEARTAADRPVPLPALPLEIGLRTLEGARAFEIRLHPEELGRIDVSLEIAEEGLVKARIQVERVETLHLLQRDARTLERAFEQAGLKTDSQGLAFSLRGDGHRGGDPRHGAGQGTAEGGTTPDARGDREPPASPILWRALGARAGGIDLSI